MLFDKTFWFPEQFYRVHQTSLLLLLSWLYQKALKLKEVICRILPVFCPWAPGAASRRILQCKYVVLYCQKCRAFCICYNTCSFFFPLPAEKLWELLASWLPHCHEVRVERGEVYHEDAKKFAKIFGFLGFKSVKKISCWCLLWEGKRENGDLSHEPLSVKVNDESPFEKSLWIKSKPVFLRGALPANGGRLRSITGQCFGHILLTSVTQNDVLMQVSRIQTGSPFIGKSPNEVTGTQPSLA